ncbi:MAG: hypothetical protein MI724_17120, partial [Spirochaetales bacterium]|nr:hypothetical protein [Spirochaetales bacterium]
MNRTVRCALWVALFLVPVGSLVAQSSSFESQSAHYRVISEISHDHAVDVGRQMESMLSLYNQQFHFPIDELETPLRVRIFATKSRFDSYLRRLVGEVRDGFVYLHYDDLEKSELVGYYTEEETLEQSLIHQSFVQFFRTFVPNPPLWLREGFAVYFEASEYDAEFGTVIYRENLAWLDTLKAMAAGNEMRSLISLDDMLSMSLPEAR